MVKNESVGKCLIHCSFSKYQLKYFGYHKLDTYVCFFQVYIWSFTSPCFKEVKVWFFFSFFLVSFLIQTCNIGISKAHSNCYRKQCGQRQLLEVLKRWLPYEIVISLLGIQSKELTVEFWNDVLRAMLTVSL